MKMTPNRNRACGTFWILAFLFFWVGPGFSSSPDVDTVHREVIVLRQEVAELRQRMPSNLQNVEVRVSSGDAEEPANQPPITGDEQSIKAAQILVAAAKLYQQGVRTWPIVDQ